MSKTRLRQLLWIYLAILVLAGIWLLILGGKRWLKPSIVVNWETASEINTVGFNLYRGTKENEELLRINQQLIPPLSDPLLGGEYEFMDYDVESGQNYFYQLEEIQNTGIAKRFNIVTAQANRDGYFEMGIGLALLLTVGFLLIKIIPGRRAITENNGNPG